MEAGEGWDVTFNFVVEGVLLLLVAALGLAGNLASFVILMRQKVQKIFHNLLFLLSTFDTVSRRLPYKIYLLFIYKEGNRILPKCDISVIFQTFIRLAKARHRMHLFIYMQSNPICPIKYGNTINTVNEQ